MPNAIFTGILYGKELARLYASCDVFVFPSSTETFGNVVLEAMASGTPVVVSSKGGQVGYVKDEFSGLVAKEKDPVDFTNKIKLLLSDNSLYNELQTNALQHAKSQSWDTLVQKLFAKYEELYNYKEN
jgi:glycosyltransferase involved in cell wall biosynthesis